MIFVQLNAAGKQDRRQGFIYQPYKVALVHLNNEYIYTSWFADIQYKVSASISEYSLSEVISLAYSVYLQYIDT